MRLGDRLLSYFAFAFVGLCSLGLAVFLASQITKRSFSQDAGSDPAATEMSPQTETSAAPPATPEDDEDEDNGDGAPAVTGDPISPMPPTEGVAPSVLAADTFLEPYIYDMREGRRNPFRPPVVAEGFVGGDLMLPGTPLERYDINELRLVGIMWDVKNPKAMFVDPQGTVHTLSRDDRIGRKRGYIALIREGEVVVVEATSFGGESQMATTILRIDK